MTAFKDTSHDDVLPADKYTFNIGDTVYYKEKDMPDAIPMRIIDIYDIPNGNGFNRCVRLIGDDGTDKFCMVEDGVLYKYYEDTTPE